MTTAAKGTISTGVLTLLATLAGLGGWALTLGTTTAPWFIYDDSYITLANALALTGYGSAFASPALTGSTSIAHTAIVAFTTLALPPETGLALANLIVAIVYAYGLARLAESLGHTRLTALGSMLLGMASGFTALHLFNGLETGLALAGITWTLVYLTNGKIYPLALLCGTLPWIRPELAAWSGIALTLGLAGNRKHRPDVSVFNTLLLLAVGSAPFLLLCWINTGYIFPLTVSAKKLFFAEGCAPVEWKNRVVLGNLLSWAGGLWLLSVGFLAMPLSSVGRGALLFFIIFIAAYWHNFPGALGHYDQRYLYIFVPFLVYACLHLLQKLPRRSAHAATASIILALVLPNLTANFPKIALRTTEGSNFTKQHLQPVASWANENIPQNSSILVHDAGYAGYKIQRPLFDFVGLKTPAAIAVHERYTHASCGEQRTLAIARIAASVSVNYIIILGTWDRIYGLSGGLKSHGVDLERAFHDPYGYTIYKINRTSDARTAPEA